MKWSEENHALQVVSLTDQEKQKWDEMLKAIQQKEVDKVESQDLPGNEYHKRLYELIEKYSQQ